jgi:hypothetical protein
LYKKTIPRKLLLSFSLSCLFGSGNKLDMF